MEVYRGHVIKIDRTEAEKRLQSKFGLQRFHDEQWMAISHLLQGRRVLMIQRTGFGKSLCFQFPATLFEGITIVFSPLIALMRDQVKGLSARGIPAGYINSEQLPEESEATLEAAIRGDLKILYIAPERQENEKWIDATRQMKISMVVVDEAHTISTWGHDFRPAFRRIIQLVKQLPETMPILAVTATATTKVQEDIAQQIGRNPLILRGDLARDNFRLFVVRVQSEEEKMLWLGQYINRLPGCGLIYAGTRSDASRYASWLQFIGVKCVEYHAGLESDSRKEIERGLMQNRWKCIVSTNALGMGLDKPDVRFVIHIQMPQSPVHYYQEIGRGGRDGLPTYIVLLFNEHVPENEDCFVDVKLPRSFIEGSRPPIKKYQKVIELLKEDPLGERQLMMKANLKQNQIRVIKADLLSQGIIKEVKYGGLKKFEYQYNAPDLDTTEFDRLRNLRISDLNDMVGYVYTAMPRMQYLCNFLDNRTDREYAGCDNTTLKSLPLRETPPQQRTILEDFKNTVFPALEVCDVTSKSVKDKGGNTLKYAVSIPKRGEIRFTINGKVLAQDKSKVAFDLLPVMDKEIFEDLYQQHISKKSRLLDGIAASYYGDSEVGAILHRCKYETGENFPNSLLHKSLQAFRKTFKGMVFDMVVYVPPTHSGSLVRNFATRFASVIGVKVSHSLVKVKETKEQKIFQNTYSKRDNIANAFTYENSKEVRGRHILLIDDIYDSGATVQEIGRMLSEMGAATVTPITIAKTIGGTL